MEHYAPHQGVAFEGYYSKFRLPSGAHLALIICSVPNATNKPSHMVSLTYYPLSGRPIFQRDHFVPRIDYITTSKANAFELRAEGLGFMRCEADENSTTTYDLTCPEWTLKATTRSRIPWKQGEPHSTPEGLLVRLPLPLHWHVHSFASTADFTLDVGSASLALPQEDRTGTALIHQEKNWADSFPAAHMWVQAHSSTSDESICLAGGKILGMTAYLLGYRAPGVSVSFTPPFALSVLGISPFMSLDIDWENRAFRICIAGLWRKIEVRASAPAEGGWFGLASPFPDGHRNNFLTESFMANVQVVVSERKQGGLLGSWTCWGEWAEVKRSTFDNASLEFGGEYFPERGADGAKKYEMV
ncbi:hypothetical protein BU24DRAFT_418119 [Aaosphaeria arxii CBS 175.79]|uniref:Uncharacterized protein n=1 Tax=Aaosphaeria arxii CBS 175.79 TaxID=1450172 RepID=A0A6A5XZ74_9PLEO|nr:uncharacterized protein BU24DRAFT_418119 [Aaosphaeria arxii CBS 175.79]KAF2018598.1 hypothetical protein BU24DRAFT_418119 [Aaosphaeria arxii CBS 175.79]